MVATGVNLVGRANIGRRAPIAKLAAGAVALASGTVSTSGLKVVIAEGALLITGAGAGWITGAGLPWITGVADCTAVKRHGSMGAMICSGGRELTLVPDAGGGVGGAAGVPEL